MAEPVYELKVITPQGIRYTGQITHVRVPVENGSVGVLAHHASYITSSAGGRLKVREESGAEKNFEVGTGFFEVNKDKAIFLAQSFEELELSIAAD